MTSEIKWQKSSFSGGGGEQCLELANAAGEILVRESDDPNVILKTTPAKLRAFIQGVRAGEFDHFAR
ncbi:DUF397 domain-containing protein [Streptomyces buecherae]|uniref:DUF397 domain-containing protein n=1 Tax=Streptomyces buecherae TaxID=2763006 RepID=A0A7H8N7V7_9ACTN|nr:DUF397 domain-containing protein [Streptomyces buecherae]QKW50634.1 DUF397 domain-containing protein [Streptomyces buecherae]